MGKNYFLTNSPLVSAGKQKKFSRQRAVVQWLLQAPESIQFVLAPCHNRYNRPDDFIFVEANEAAGAMMGKSLKDLIGQRLIELLNINPFHSFFQNYLRTFLYHTPLEENIEFPLLARQGKRITHRAEVVDDVLVVTVKVESLHQGDARGEVETQLEDALTEAESREQGLKHTVEQKPVDTVAPISDELDKEQETPILAEAAQKPVDTAAPISDELDKEQETPILAEAEHIGTTVSLSDGLGKVKETPVLAKAGYTENLTIKGVEKARYETIETSKNFTLATFELETEEDAAATQEESSSFTLATFELESKVILAQKTTPKPVNEEPIQVNNLPQVPDANTQEVTAKPMTVVEVQTDSFEPIKVSQEVSLEGKIEYTDPTLAKVLELENTHPSGVFMQDILHKVSQLPYQLAMTKAKAGQKVEDLPLTFTTQSGNYVKVKALIVPQTNQGKVVSIHHFFEIVHSTPHFHEISSFGQVPSFNAF
ncbi:PAS domain-containing protein [uncultured Microscilla sp.]|uniref:PAS domain-containing protein n=1 Tax=uncultured Microscilla sp. TaxID=432653 RepID=UPI002629AA62|nr:PAS domain-containing protein [uncultured Microscilla sp.]